MKRDQEFREFASATMAPSMRLPTLLAGDADQGRELLTAALADVHRRWRRVRSGQARADLLRRRLVRRALTIEHPAGDETPGAEGSALGWLQALPAQRRVVLVLLAVEDLTVAGTARVTGLSESAVDRLSQ